MLCRTPLVGGRLARRSPRAQRPEAHRPDAHRCQPAGAHPAPRRPWPDDLEPTVDLRELDRSAPGRALEQLPARVDDLPTIGLAEDTLAPRDFAPEGTFIVAGHPGSGKTNAMRAMAVAMERFDPDVKLYSAGRRSVLHDRRPWVRSVTRPDAAKELTKELTELVAGETIPGRIGIVVEDVPQVTGGYGFIGDVKTGRKGIAPTGARPRAYRHGRHPGGCAGVPHFSMTVRLPPVGVSVSLLAVGSRRPREAGGVRLLLLLRSVPSGSCCNAPGGWGARAS